MNNNQQFQPTPGYQTYQRPAAPALRNNNNNGGLPYTNMNPAVSGNPFKTTGKKNYLWSVWFCCCSRMLDALGFMRAYHSGQVCHDTVFFIFALLGVIGRIANLTQPEEDRVENVGTNDARADLFGALIYAIFMLITLILNCYASGKVKSPVQGTRKQGRYTLATVFGILSSIITTIIFFFLGAVVILGALIVHAFLELYDSDTDQPLPYIIAFACSGVVLFFIALFPLCQAVKGCTNCSAVSEFNDLNGVNRYR